MQLLTIQSIDRHFSQATGQHLHESDAIAARIADPALPVAIESRLRLDQESFAAHTQICSGRMDVRDLQAQVVDAVHFYKSLHITEKIPVTG